MDEQILLSIVIPVYQAENFIETAIQSVLRQNAEWVELILINDGSHDSSEVICKKYEGKNVQLKSIQNSGAGYARNYGIKHAKGKWIAFLDSDDLILSNTLNEHLFQTLQCAWRRKCDILYGGKLECNMMLSDEPRITLPEPLSKIKNYIPEMEFWTCIYRADFLRSKNIKFFEYQKQDIESAFRFRAFSNAERIEVQPELIFCVHRNNPNSNVNTWSLDNLYEIKACVYFQLFEEYNNKNLEVSSFLLKEALFNAKSLFKNCIKNGVTENTKQQIDNVLAVHKNCKIDEVKTILSLKYKVLCTAFDLLDVGCVKNFVFWLLNKKKRSVVSKAKQVELQQDNMSVIFENMDKYTEHQDNALLY